MAPNLMQTRAAEPAADPRPVPHPGGLEGPVPARDVSLGANLRRLALLTSDWPGLPLDSPGTIRVLNPDAAGAPLFWCFNGRQEFPALAAALVDDRPVVGMRSLNQIVDYGPSRHFSDLNLAEYYADRILRHFGRIPCLVGGNCQAAPVAHGVAMRLLDAGARVDCLITVEAVTKRHYPGHMRLLFSASSVKYNPFLTQPAPQLAWDYHYQSCDWQVMPAVHGQFFAAGHVTLLAQAIAADTPDKSPSPPGAGFDLHWTLASPGPCKAGGVIDLIAPAPIIGAGETTGLMLLAHWTATAIGAWVCEQDGYLSPIWFQPDRGLYRAQIRLPDQPGQWVLEPVACRQHHGPLTPAGFRPQPVQVDIL